MSGSRRKMRSALLYAGAVCLIGILVLFVMFALRRPKPPGDSHAIVDNLISLSAAYSSFLTGLAGVCITVLTLVLTLGKEENNRTVSLPLVTLVVTTVSCLVGSHLLAETAALGFHHEGDAEPTGILRFYWLGSINLYLSAVFFIFALALLTVVYERNGFTETAKNVAFLMFLCINLGAALWMHRFVWMTWQQPASGPGLRAAFSTAAVLCVAGLGIGVTAEPEEERLRGLPFYLAAAASFGSLVWFANTFDLRRPPDFPDLLFYVTASSVPCAALLGVGLKVYWRGRQRRQQAQKQAGSAAPVETMHSSLSPLS